MRIITLILVALSLIAQSWGLKPIRTKDDRVLDRAYYEAVKKTRNLVGRFLEAL